MRMDIQVAITLLTICVVLLSVVILGLLITVIALLVQLRRVAQRVDHITTNVAAATDWLVPSKIFSEVARLFRK